MAKPPEEYRLSAPNTGSYRLSPQAAPISTYVRPKQINPNLTDYKAQVDSFQNFVKSMADWRATENQDNQGRAQLRALADNARGVLDANLEDEDEDYQKYGRFLQGKNYGKEIGTKLIAEITTGSEGQMGLMDQAFAQSKLPENHNRKVEDIFSEMLEDRKDHYRDQVPDSSDEFYSGFGEAMQPFASEINKAFYEKVQKETFNGRRENFSQSLRQELESDILAVSRGEKDIEFNQEYLRNLSASFSSVAGLSEDAALGESIRILNSEIGQIIENADSEEDLEMAEKMLSIFDTVIKSKPGVKGRALLIDIPIFKEDAQRAYTSLGGAIDQQRKIIEAKEEEDKKQKRSNQEISAIASLVAGGELGDIKTLQANNPNLEPEDYYQLLNLQESIKTRNKNKEYKRKDFGNALVKAKQGALSYNDALTLFTKEEISEQNFQTLTTAINQSKKYDTKALQLFENRVVQNLKTLPPGFSLDLLKTSDQEAYSTIQDNLLELQITIIEEAEKALEGNTTTLDFSQQQELLSQVRETPKVKQAIDNYNNFITSTFGETKGNKGVNNEEDPEQIIENKYFGPDATYENLYEDFFQLSLAERGKLTGGSDALAEDNAFRGLSLAEARKLLPQLKSKLKDENIPGFNEWAYQRIKSTNMGHWSMNTAMRNAFRAVWERVGKDEEFPEPSTMENILGVVGKKVQSNEEGTTTQRRISARRSKQKVGTNVKKEKYSEPPTESRKKARR